MKLVLSEALVFEKRWFQFGCELQICCSLLLLGYAYEMQFLVLGEGFF